MMPYSYAWRVRRPADLANAGHRCERCGDPGWFEDYRNLERAHLDGDRANDAPENIAVLCIPCHKRHDYPQWAVKCRETRAARKDDARPLLAKLKEAEYETSNLQ